MRRGALALLFSLAGCYEAHRLEPDVGPIDARIGCGTCASIAACTPGSSWLVGCTSSVGRRCTGDPTLSICDASVVPDPEACSSSGAILAFVDDADGLCPEVVVMCPRSGRLAIDTEPFGGSRDFFCEWDVRPSR